MLLHALWFGSAFIVTGFALVLNIIILPSNDTVSVEINFFTQWLGQDNADVLVLHVFWVFDSRLSTH